MPLQPRQYIAIGVGVLATVLLLIAIAALGRDGEPEEDAGAPTGTATVTGSPPVTPTVTAPSALPSPTATGAPTATPSPAGGTPTTQPTTPAATPTPTAAQPTPSATPVFLPSVTPTPAIPGEPIASTANIPRGSLPVVEFVRNGAVIARLPIEVPPRDEYSIGLSGRRTFENDRGMLFHYAEQGGAFWMRNTHFDLAIAFVAADETIVDIQEMQAESTELTNSRGPYKYAIEAPAGWYLRNGVRMGDSAQLAFTLPPYLQGG